MMSCREFLKQSIKSHCELAKRLKDLMILALNCTVPLSGRTFRMSGAYFGCLCTGEVSLCAGEYN